MRKLAASTDPLTGEGIGNTMQSGRLAAMCAASSDVHAYDARVWKLLGPGLDASYRLQRLATHRVTGRVIIALHDANDGVPNLRMPCGLADQRLCSPR